MVAGTVMLCRFRVKTRDTLLLVLMTTSSFVTLSQSFVLRSFATTSPSFVPSAFHTHHRSISERHGSTRRIVVAKISTNVEGRRQQFQNSALMLPSLSLSSQFRYVTSTTNLSMSARGNGSETNKSKNKNSKNKEAKNTPKRKNIQNTDDELNSLMSDVDNLLAELTSSKDSSMSQNQNGDKSQGTDSNGNTKKNGWVILDWTSIIPPARERSSMPSSDYSLTRRQDLRHLTGSDKPSPVEAVFVRNRIVYIKRDDLLRLEGSHVSGNKARKMYSLNQVPASEFPDCVVSYGGPQSNAMVALAAIVHSKNMELMEDTDNDRYGLDNPSTGENDESYESQILSLDDLSINGDTRINNDDKYDREGKGSTVKPSERIATKTKKRFVYYTKKLPRFLKNQPNGNLFRALTLGMEIVELTHEEYKDLFGSETGGRPEAPQGLAPPVPGGSLWIPQGGACGVALLGGQILAEEIVSFWSQQNNGRPLSVLVPGGTCSTALLLHREIQALQAKNMEYEQLDIRIVVIPCVGDDAYARRQMMALNVETGGSGRQDDIPDVLSPIPDSSYVGESRKKKLGYFNFGEPHASILETFRELKADGVSLDLLYGAPAWTVLLRHWRESNDDNTSPMTGRELMYVHSGGLEGVVSQLMRYKYKGLVDADEIQLPGKNRQSTDNQK